MALSRKFLESYGLEGKVVDEIITAHSDTVSGLKDQIDKLTADNTALEGIKKEFDELQKGDYKTKYDATAKEYADYKAGVEAKAAAAAKESAVKAYYEAKGITGANLKIAMRGTDLAKIDLDGNKIKDAKCLDDLVAGDYATLVAKEPQKNTIDTGAPLGGKQTQDAPQTLRDALVERYKK